MRHGTSAAPRIPIAIYGALAANAGIAVIKFVVALLSGSSAILAEAIHSTIDTGNECLLLVGEHRSRKPADAGHPYGHGKEIYFWSLLVAMVLFAVGGGMSIYEGIVHLKTPHRLESVSGTYALLVCAALFEGMSLAIAIRQLRRAQRNMPLLDAFRASKNPSVFVVVGEDSAALLGLLIAAAGVSLNHFANVLWADAAASIAIGAVLCGVAVLLTHESRGLLVGESADPKIVEEIRAIAKEDDAIEEVLTVLTMHLGPRQVLLNLDVRFRDDLDMRSLTGAVRRLEDAIRARFPIVDRIFVEANSIERADGTRASR